MSLKIPKVSCVTQTENYVRSLFENEGSGHDWWHIYRVRNMALKIAEQEGGDKFVIEVASLLHDLDDWKLNNDDGFKKTVDWLCKLDIKESERNNTLDCIKQVSFKGAKVKTAADSIEAQIVQDADRLDAIGAIGIARTFAYGGSKGRLIYHPDIKPVMHKSFQDYKKTTAPTINHFYEKLLLLKDRLNTKTAKRIAYKRHKMMEDFLKQFFNEWEGNF